MRSDAAVGIVALVMKAHCRIARTGGTTRTGVEGCVVWSECCPTLPSASNSTHRQFQRDAGEYGDQCGVASGEQVGGYRLDPSRFRSAVSRERWLWRLPGPIAQHSRPPSSGGAPDRSAGPAPFHHPLVDLQAARSAGIAVVGALIIPVLAAKAHSPRFGLTLRLLAHPHRYALDWWPQVASHQLKWSTRTRPVSMLHVRSPLPR